MSTPLLIALILITLLILTCIILLVRALYEPHILTVSHEELDDNASSDPDINICFISDLHAEMCFIKPETTLNAIENEMSKRPVDMVIFGGDICNNPLKYQKGVSYLQKISSFCKERNIIFAGVTGNHDIELDGKVINSCGFMNLKDEPLIFESKNGYRYQITGVSDSGRKNRKWDKVIASNGNMPNILVSHNPDILLHTENLNEIDYCLSGHIHGGQIRTPFKIEFNVLRKDEFPKTGIFYGKHIYKNCKLYIGRGIGCILLPLRLGAKPEISFITIKNR